MPKERDATFDILKGLGMVGVICGHFSNKTMPFVYTFHMPLFFLVAGYFFTARGFLTTLKKDISRLVVPFMLTCLVLIVLGAMEAIAKGDSVMRAIIGGIGSMIFPNGMEHPAVTGITGFSIGGLILWFLLALFWCKTVYNLLSKYLSTNALLIVSLGVSLAAIYIDTEVMKMPLGILPGLGAVIFFAIGKFIKENREKNGKMLAIFLGICLVIWLRFIIFEHEKNIEMYHNEYNFYPHDVVAAIGGTFAMWLLSKFALKRVSFVGDFLTFFGANSLLIICLHTIDHDHSLLRVFGIRAGGLHLLLAFPMYAFATVLLYKWEWARRIFGIRPYKLTTEERKENVGKSSVEIPSLSEDSDMGR